MIHSTFQFRPRFWPVICCLILFWAALLWPLPNTYRAAWLANLLDLGHIPLLAGVTVALYVASAGRRAWACGGAVLLAALGELGQFLVGREPGWVDFAHGLAGVAVAALGLRVWSRPRSWRRWAAALAAAALLAGWLVYGYGPVLLDALLARRAFPVLADFRSPWEPLRWRTEAASLRRVRGGEGDWQGIVDFLPRQTRLSSVVLCPIRRDWRGYRALHLELSCGERIRGLMLSVRDGKRISPPQRRFELWTQLAAGPHHVRLDLQQLAAGGDFAALDLSRIQSLHLCSRDAEGQQTLTIHRIWLE